mmetsp:Transcript_700/g.1228  ORF Transcript_700/g.1228 Transcript_700/m.1228 type:complete len:512 (-) Transcript_700:865-2400(-)
MDDCQCECRERQEAELDFVQSAYTEQEAWITTTSSTSSHASSGEVINTIHRRLDLQCDDNTKNDDNHAAAIIPVEILITLPLMYPVDESSLAHVDVSLLDSSTTATATATTTTTTIGLTTANLSLRKLVINSLPSLLQVCRDISKEFAGQEAVFAILSRADEWLHQEWRGILSMTMTRTSNNNNNHDDDNEEKQSSPSICNNQELVLARKLIYSHHIIAKSKRKAIADLSRDYELGGYAKIGWPGIIIVEGEESNCNQFIEEIKGMRWQYLVVRGEEFERVGNGDMHQLNQLRRFPIKMEELGEDQISHLANVCRQVGLESLFISFMKIKDKDPLVQVNDEKATTTTGGRNGTLSTNHQHNSYGALVHVDHMNNKKGYEKWLEKACKSVGCMHSVIRFCHHTNSSDSSRPLNFVLIVAHGGDESSVKQVLKKWRTSKVDVDSKGMPCLERMMSVVVEDEIKDTRDLKEIIEDLKALPKSIEHDIVSFTDATEFLTKLGGPTWRDAIFDYLS